MAGDRPMNESRVSVRIAPEDRALFEAAAERQGESLAEFLLANRRLRAERLLADRTTFAVDSVDHAAIIAAIERPPPSGRSWSVSFAGRPRLSAVGV